MSLAEPYPPPTRGTIVFWGFLATYPFGGFTWQVLHHLRGARRLGFDVWYVEDTGSTELYDVEGLEFTYRYEGNLRHLAKWMDAVGLGDRWVYRPPRSSEVFGARDARGLEDLYRDADVVVNLCGSHWVRDEHAAIRCLVYLETDPVASQVAVASGDELVVSQLTRHDHHFTYGLNLGAEDCLVPVEGFAWRPTRPPVSLEWWTDAGSPGPDAAMTTVTNWRFDRSVNWRGRTWLWSKHRQFLRLIDLPGASPLPLELALGGGITEEEKARLRSHGWRVRPAADLYDPDAYRSYVRGSLGELTVSKEMVVDSRSGWFSDRSVCYLAAGRPVVVQDSGFGKYVPTGRGLFAFESRDEALAALGELAADYEGQSRAAVEIAREYFADDRILGELFRQVGVL